MNSDPILYNSDQPENVLKRPVATPSGLTGFLLKQGLVSSVQQANIVLVVISLVLIVLAIVIPFVW